MPLNDRHDAPGTSPAQGTKRGRAVSAVEIEQGTERFALTERSDGGELAELLGSTRRDIWLSRLAVGLPVFVFVGDPNVGTAARLVPGQFGAIWLEDYSSDVLHEQLVWLAQETRRVERVEQERDEDPPSDAASKGRSMMAHVRQEQMR